MVSWVVGGVQATILTCQTKAVLWRLILTEINYVLNVVDMSVAYGHGNKSSIRI